MKISGELLRQLIEIWNFVADNGLHIILDLYTDFFALNFGGIMHCDSFTELSHALLKACISHPLLTVDSERHLCEALLNWLANNFQCSKFSTKIGENSDILEKVRIGLLPLEFILGQLFVKYPSMGASFQTTTMFDHISHARINNHFDIQAGYLESFRLRLTQYSEEEGALEEGEVVERSTLSLFKSSIRQGVSCVILASHLITIPFVPLACKLLLLWYNINTSLFVVFYVSGGCTWTN